VVFSVVNGAVTLISNKHNLVKLVKQKPKQQTNAVIGILAAHSRVGTARIHAGRVDAAQDDGQMLHWGTLATGHLGGLSHCLQER